MLRFIRGFQRSGHAPPSAAEASSSGNIPCGVAWSVGYFGLLVVLFQALRLILLWVNRELAASVDGAALARAFWVGLRFDLAVAAYITLGQFAFVSFVGLLAGRCAQRQVFFYGAAASFAVLALLGFGEAEFYREYFSRFNTLALHYWKQPATVLSAIWYGYPVLKYLAAVAGITFVLVVALRRAVRRFPVPTAPLASTWKREAVWGMAFAALLLLVARGGFRSTPLKWGDAVHSETMFANQLALNGFWTLGQAALNDENHDFCADLWPNRMPDAQAREIAQSLVLLPHEKLTGDNRKYPLLRFAASDDPRTVSLKKTGSLKESEQGPPNVVVIIMESFTARLCGACGADRSDDDYSPEFNKLVKQGVLFNRCFSVGTHTHQANVGVVADFPNLPGHEDLMEDFNLGNQSFDSLPRAFKQRGYDTTFIYNGAFEWENMRGFHSIQGTRRFIGRDDFDRHSYFDHTWGVSDKDLFDRANEEFAKAKKPFYATVLTLSNHAPFELPRPLPFPEVTGHGGMNQRLNGMRYADWALGQFFKRARREPYFRNTLFVLVGDHGCSIAPILTELRLLRFHIPLLFYALSCSPRRARHATQSPASWTLLPPCCGWWATERRTSIGDATCLAFRPATPATPSSNPAKTAPKSVSLGATCCW